MKSGEIRSFKLQCFHPNESGLGDLLLMGADVKTHNDVLVVLTDKKAHLAPLFYGMAPVLVTANYESDIQASEANGIPEIRLTDSELSEGRAYVASVKRPVAVCINCAPAWKHLRETKMLTWERICSRLLARHYTPLQFGLSSNFTPIAGVEAHLDLPVRKLAAVYAAIGFYVGIDTGDRWLMIAAGGQSFVLCPPECSDYPYALWHRDCGGRAKYFTFDQVPELYDSIDAR